MARILIAEDSHTVVEVMRRALAPLGHEVLVVDDGEEAERRVAEQKPDLLILDIIMPKKNGFQVCRALRQNQQNRNLRILVVTQMDRESDRYWGMKQGADDYLTKPFDAKYFVEKVRTLLAH